MRNLWKLFLYLGQSLQSVNDNYSSIELFVNFYNLAGCFESVYNYRHQFLFCCNVQTWSKWFILWREKVNKSAFVSLYFQFFTFLIDSFECTENRLNFFHFLNKSLQLLILNFNFLFTLISFEYLISYISSSFSFISLNLFNMIDRFLNIWLNCINIILDILQLTIDLLNRWSYFDFLLIDITHIDSDWWEQSVQFTLFILIKFIYFILVQCFILGVSLNKKLIFFFWSNINIVLHFLNFFLSCLPLNFQILNFNFLFYNLIFYFFWLFYLFLWVFSIQNIVNINFLNIWVKIRWFLNF